MPFRLMGEGPGTNLPAPGPLGEFELLTITGHVHRFNALPAFQLCSAARQRWRGYFPDPVVPGSAAPLPAQIFAGRVIRWHYSSQLVLCSHLVLRVAGLAFLSAARMVWPLCPAPPHCPLALSWPCDLNLSGLPCCAPVRLPHHFLSLNNENHTHTPRQCLLPLLQIF